MTKLSVLMTVFNEGDFVEYAINSIVPYVKDLVIVEGAYQESIEIGCEARSTDGTIEKIKNIIDHEDEEGESWDKVHYLEANEKSDKDQRNVGLELIKKLNPDGWLLIVDGDEVYSKNTLKIAMKVAKILESQGRYAAYFTSLTFVNDLDHYTAQHFPRLFKITPDCKFVDDNQMDWNIPNVRWDINSVRKLDYIKYHHYSFVKGTERFLMKKKWWETRFDKPFDYGWAVDSDGNIDDPGHKILKFEGKHPEIMKDHPLLVGDKMKHKISIIGAGFVGTAVETGFQEIADVAIYDKFKDTDSLETVVNHSDIIFICVPTPMKENGSCDTSIVEGVIERAVDIADTMKTFVIKSTVPPGTTERLEWKHEHEHVFVFNPEYLTAKNAINDFLNQDRIVLGTVDKKSCHKLAFLMRDFAKNQQSPAKIIFTTSRSAEMAKYVANSYLATKVAYFNEIHEICEEMDIDYDEVVGIVTQDKRITHSHTQVPGPDGQKMFGGSCFPKDIQSLIHFAREYDADPMLLETCWAKNLLLRDVYDWEEIPGATTFGKKTGEK